MFTVFDLMHLTKDGAAVGRVDLEWLSLGWELLWGERNNMICQGVRRRVGMREEMWPRYTEREWVGERERERGKESSWMTWRERRIKRWLTVKAPLALGSCVCVQVKKRERTSIVTCLEHKTLIWSREMVIITLAKCTNMFMMRHNDGLVIQQWTSLLVYLNFSTSSF